MLPRARNAATRCSFETSIPSSTMANSLARSPSARTCSASHPRPTTRFRPFRNRISILASVGVLGSGAAATFTSTKRLAPSDFAPGTLAQVLLPPVKVRHAQPALPAERRHTPRAPPLLGNQPPPLRSHPPAPFSLCHCPCLPATRHSAPLHLAQQDALHVSLNNLRHSLSNWLVNKAKVEPKTVQGILLYLAGDGRTPGDRWRGL